MALTATQKAQIRLALGHPDGWRYANTRLESVLDNVSPEAETQIAAILVSLATIETQILTTAATAASGISRVDEISFFPTINGVSVGFKNGKDAARYLAGRLSIILGVPIANNAYGAAGFGGDSFFPGFGNPILLG